MLTSSINSRCDRRSAVTVGVPGGAENRPVISRWVALKSSGTGQWLATTSRPPAPTKARTRPSSATSPPVPRPAWLGRGGARLAGRVAGREDDEIGVEVQVEDLAEGQQAVRAAAAEARQQRGLRRALAARAVTTPWVAKWRMR